MNLTRSMLIHEESWKIKTEMIPVDIESQVYQYLESLFPIMWVFIRTESKKARYSRQMK